MSNARILEVRTCGPGAQTWIMQAAPVNAIAPEFLAAFESQLANATADESIAAVVLTSGLKVFSAGADASWMAQVVKDEGPEGLLERFNRTMDSFRELCLALRRSPILFIAALNGHTLAGGLELAAACDLRFAASAEKLQIGAPEMDLFGEMPSGGGGAQFLSRLMGPTRALRFVIDAKPVSPERALHLGLVDALFPADELLEQAEEFALAAAAKAGRVGLAAAKRSILGAAELPLDEALEVDRTVHWDAMRRGNFLGGVEAFVTRFG